MGRVLENLVKLFAWIEALSAVFQISVGIYALIFVSETFTVSKEGGNSMEDLEDRKVGVHQLLLLVLIKFIYLLILFFLSEVALAAYLLRAVHHRRLNELRIWLIVASVYTALYLTDFISTLHAMAMVEDMTVTFGIFIKVPLLFFTFRYYKELSLNGDNLENDLV